MIYLIISIIFMTLMAVALRMGADRGAHGLGLSLIFRIVAGLVMTAIALFQLDWTNIALWRQVLPYGALGAVFFWFSGYTTINAVKLGHMGITFTVLRMSMLLPTLASIFYWHEITLLPVNSIGIMRLTGVALAVGAIILMSFDRFSRAKAVSVLPEHSKRARHWILWTAAMFLSQGSWEVVLRASRNIQHEQGRAFFITMIFLFSLIASLILLIAIRPPVGKVEITFGVFAGLSSLIASGVRPWVLKHLDGVIVFPVTTTSVMLLILALGAVFWRERLGRPGLCGIAVAILATLLLTLKPLAIGT